MKKLRNSAFFDFESVIRLFPLLLLVGMLSAFFGYRLYFPFLHLSLGYVDSFFVMCSLCLLVQFGIDSVPFFKTTVPGLIMNTVLTAESVLFLLFLQYHPVLSLLFAALTVGISAGIYRFVKKTNAHRKTDSSAFRRACRQHAAVLTAVILCLVLAVPAGIGAYSEYFAPSLSEEDWAAFVEYLNAYAEAEENGKKVLSAAEEPLAGLADWDDLSQKERERLLRTVAMTEKEALGIADEVELTVETVKTEQDTYGSYNDKLKRISISYEQLHEASLEEMLDTVLHEMHHAYVHYTVESLDFTSEEVQTGYYFKEAREWKENIENYRSANVSYSAYRNQPIEVAARAYAEDRIQVYLDIAEKADAATTVG